MAKFLVSVLSLNRVEGVKKCLSAVLAGGGDFILRLVDNASSDGTGRYFEQLSASDPRVISPTIEKENQGFQIPNEESLRHAIAREIPYLVLLNDDTRPPAGWLDRMAAVFDRDPGVAAVGALGGCNEITPAFHGTGGVRLEYIEGSCLMIDIKKLLRVRSTLFDPNLTFMYGEDADLSLELRRAGWRIAQVNMNIEHLGAASRLANPELKARCEAAEAKNHKYLLRKWAHYLKVRRFDHRIVVRRRHASGDVVLITPFLRALAKQNPLSPLFVETMFPDLFYGNPHVSYAAQKVHPLADDLTIDLDMVSENGPMRHFVSSYFSAGPIDLPRPKKYVTEMHFDQAWQKPAPGRWCAMHVGPTTWKAKNWPYDRFNAVAELLSVKGWKIVLVGNGSDGDVVRHQDYRNQTTTRQLAAILAGCDLFVGVDSFPMHVAQAVGTPTVGIFGVTEGKYIMTDGSPHVSCDADPMHPRAGERHRVAGVCYIDEPGDVIRTVSVTQVLKAIDSLTK